MWWLVTWNVRKLADFDDNIRLLVIQQMKENTGEKPKFKPKRTAAVSKKGGKQRKMRARTPQ